VVFMAVGFETTAPTTAVPLSKGVPENFSVYSCHRIVPPALEAIFEMGEIKVDGFIQPGHVSVITDWGYSSRSPPNTGCRRSSPVSSRSTF